MSTEFQAITDNWRYICDMCKQPASSDLELPDGWYSLELYQAKCPVVESKRSYHLCSDECVAKFTAPSDLYIDLRDNTTLLGNLPDPWKNQPDK